MDAFADLHEVQGLLAGLVGDAETAAEVDELDMDAELLFEFDGQREHQLGCEQEGFGAALVRGDHRMEAEAADAFVLRYSVGFKQLVAGQAVFGFSRLANDIVAFDEVARVVAEAENLGQASMFLEVFDMADVVEVDDGTEFDGFLEFICRSIVGGQKDFLALYAGDVGKQQLGKTAAVGAGTFLMQDLHDAWIGQCFDCKLFAEGGGPGKGFLQGADIFADCLFVIDVEWRRILGDDFLQTVFVQWKYFFCHGDYLLITIENYS